MCNACGCSTGVDGMSAVERVKASSHALRGSIREELREESACFSDEAVQILKFHGVYQQDDRDRRKEARRLGLDKHHMMMIRTRIPGGAVPPEAYLAHDRIADELGNGTLRVTTRQDFQLHGVLKRDLHGAIRIINESLLTTLGGCGDQERNIMSCPAPLDTTLRRDVRGRLGALVSGLTPTTRAYAEVWLDGELAASSEPDTPDPLYGDRYLPRKFKTAIAIEGDNCVDVYTNDLGLVARAGRNGRLAAFDVLVGGGLGRTANKPDTWPAVAQHMGQVPARLVVDAARAVVAVQRDYGNRADRRHARLKYLLADRGLDWFRGEVETRLGFELRPPQLLRWASADDHLGWHAQGDGLFFYGLFVENGRIQDAGGQNLRSALRALVVALRPHVRLTPQQNVLITGLREGDKALVLRTLEQCGVTPSEGIPSAIRHSMACPAWPTCGLAVAESERVMPGLIRRIDVVQRDAGLDQERISYRMTGCPNGCARPYVGDVGFVGTTLGKYDVFLGGDADGTRLNQLYAHNVRFEDIPELLRGPLIEYVAGRGDGESFGDWCARRGVSQLAAQHSRLDETA